jgi:hypothetical protein
MPVFSSEENTKYGEIVIALTKTILSRANDIAVENKSNLNAEIMTINDFLCATLIELVRGKDAPLEFLLRTANIHKQNLDGLLELRDLVIKNGLSESSAEVILDDLITKAKEDLQ